MKKFIFVLIAVLSLSSLTYAEDPPKVKFTGGVLSNLDKTFPVFELEVDFPFNIKKMRGFGVARMGALSGTDISLDQPDSWSSAQVVAGLHKTVASAEYPNASMRTGLCIFVGGKTPLTGRTDVIPTLAKFGGVGFIVRDIKSGSWGVIAYGIDEEGLPYVEPGRDLPQGYYGMGQILASAKLRVPNTADIVWFGVETSVNIGRNQFAENKDVLKAWVSFDPVSVLGKFRGE